MTYLSIEVFPKQSFKSPCAPPPAPAILPLSSPHPFLPAAPQNFKESGPEGELCKGWQKSLPTPLRNGPRFDRLDDVRLVRTRVERRVGRQQDAVLDLFDEVRTEVPIASS